MRIQWPTVLFMTVVHIFALVALQPQYWSLGSLSVLLRRIYDSLYTSLVPATIPAAVLILAKYQYQIAFVADQEINLLACLTEIMVECNFQ